jgi:hypothetical protein
MPKGSRIHGALIILMAVCFLSICVPRAASAANAGAGSAQAFVTYKYIDPACGLEAFRLLIPKGWRAEGSVKWSMTPALPIQVRFRFYNPNGSEELNFLPSHSYFWTSNRQTLALKPPGSQMYGSTVAQPVGLRAAFNSVVIPGARKNAQGLRTLSETDVPELEALAKGAAAPGVDARARAGKVRINYQQNGRQMEEEIYAAVSQFIVNTSRTDFINFWFIDNVFSFRAQKGKLDAAAGTFQTMIYSVKLNPAWYAKVANVKEMLAKQEIEKTIRIGRIGDMISRAGSKMREDQYRSWEANQKVYDRIGKLRSDTIRGVDRYYDERAGREVELPTGGHAWSNGLGEYYVTERASDNPNIGSNLHWEQLPRAR